MPGNAFSYLRDNFTDNVQGEAWGGSFVTGSATKAETSGQARLTLPSSTAGTHSAYYRTGGTYNLTGDSFYWTIDTMVATGVAATATLDLYDTVDPTNILRWQQLSNAITARKVIAGVDTQLYTATWNSSTYKYLRIRESGGSILFDSSSNGTSWTNRATITGIPFDISLMAIQFGCSCGNVASPGSLRIEDVNLILPALTTTWHWTQVEWPLLYRFKSITLGATGGQGYIATSNDGTTWVYYSGPIGSSSGGYNSLTLQGSQAAAEAMAVTLPATDRWDLPSIVECRFIRLYHRSISGSSYGISEYYPRRLVQSDDIEAESIQAINIAANAITADKIFVLSLSALTASMGSLTMDGPIDITTGSIIGGGGVVTLDSGGLAIQQSASVLSIQSLQMIKADGTVIGRYGGSYATSHGLFIEGMAITGEQSFVDLTARAGTTDGAITYLRAVSGAVPALITLTSTGAAATIDLSASAGVTIAGAAAGLSIGTTGAGAGQIVTTGSVAFGQAIDTTSRIAVKGAGATTATYTIVALNSSGTNTFYVSNGSTGFLNAASWLYSSDATRKRNIRNLNKDIVDFMRLDGKIFDYIDGPTDRYGYIAQDVQAIIPSVIETLPDGSLGMRTDEINIIGHAVLRRLIRILVQKGVLIPADIA